METKHNLKTISERLGETPRERFERICQIILLAFVVFAACGCSDRYTVMYKVIPDPELSDKVIIYSGNVYFVNVIDETGKTKELLVGRSLQYENFRIKKLQGEKQSYLKVKYGVRNYSHEPSIRKVTLYYSSDIVFVDIMQRNSHLK
jgi:hypothetical protein